VVFCRLILHTENMADEKIGEITDFTLEEGRMALDQLERHLQHKSLPDPESDRALDPGRQTSLSFERRHLDQAPRGLRLNNRMGSPLGLTIEELDDRGLLEGGALPSSYASNRQRGRRALEMKKRSSRLQERGKEVIVM
jgi:hypothetical protein